jgi:hypothetical protein
MITLPRYILCGSRSKLAVEFTGAEADWDFAAPNNAETHDALESQGFTFSKYNNYFDSQTVIVYTKFDYSTLCTIQVTIKKDYDLFCRVWDKITPEFFTKYIWKRSITYRNWDANIVRDHIKEIMNQLFEIAKND